MSDSSCKCDLFNAVAEGVARQPEAENKITQAVSFATAFIDVVRTLKICDKKDTCGGGDNGFCKFVTQPMTLVMGFPIGFRVLGTLC